jgi:putative peptidoglycan lipid II flippase
VSEGKEGSSAKGAVLVAAGIFLSRIFGLVRERVFAHYLGNSVAAAAFKAGLRIPNLLQNLFGEGVLSASFIPAYARLLGQGKKEEAERLAGAVLSLLCLAVAVVVVPGVLYAEQLVDWVAPGFEGEGRRLAAEVVAILFPATGLLVISAWCLGVLNSHRRFFLSYAAPVIWSSTIILALVYGRDQDLPTLAHYAAWGTLAGSLLQVLVQLPAVLGLLGRLRPNLAITADVKQVLHNFGPVVLGRGVVQLSAFIDTAFASLIAERALSALTYAQTLYLLPVSLFGMSVSAAELPEMAQVQGAADEVAAKLRVRIEAGLSRISFFVVPSAVAMITFGDLLGGALFQTGRFSAGDARFLWYILIGAGLGLLASTSGRLYASAFYAQRDTRTPLRIAMVRVVLTATLGYAASLWLPGLLGLPIHLGAVGITGVSSLAAVVELWYLRSRLEQRFGRARLPKGRLLTLYGAAFAGAALGLVIKWVLTQILGVDHAAAEEWGGSVFPPPALHPIFATLLVVGPFGLLYLALTWWWEVPLARSLGARISARIIR